MYIGTFLSSNHLTHDAFTELAADVLFVLVLQEATRLKKGEVDKIGAKEIGVP